MSKAADIAPTTRLVVGPFNRVEGDLEVRLDLHGRKVHEAWVKASMFRGFETMLQGKQAADALAIVPRICGICSISQSNAAALSLAQAQGLVPPANAVWLANTMLAVENLADHLTHFYLFFMPDFCRPVYARQPWFAEAMRRFAALAGEHSRKAVAARQRWFHILGTLGGKWPHTHSILPGGFSRALSKTECQRLLALTREFSLFVQEILLGSGIAQFTQLQNENDLQVWGDDNPQTGDVRFFLRLAQEADLRYMGQAPRSYLSFGAYPRLPEAFPSNPSADNENTASFFYRNGIWQPAALAAVQAVNPALIQEDTHAAWYRSQTPLPPSVGETVVDAHKAEAYTWNKAPRYAGQVLQTGALARQVVAGNPLLRDLEGRYGSTVYTRVLARLYEIAAGIQVVQRCLHNVQPSEPFYKQSPVAASGSGIGMVEAARGALGHWVSLERGLIARYQIVAPTGWNFSPRDAAGQPGALEQALVGAPLLATETSPVAVQHIVRSFDPCMVCTVH